MREPKPLRNSQVAASPAARLALPVLACTLALHAMEMQPHLYGEALTLAHCIEGPAVVQVNRAHFRMAPRRLRFAYKNNMFSGLPLSILHKFPLTCKRASYLCLTVADSCWLAGSFEVCVSI